MPYSWICTNSLLIMEIFSNSSRSFSLLFNGFSRKFLGPRSNLSLSEDRCKQTQNNKHTNANRSLKQQQQQINKHLQLHTITRWIIKNTSLQPHSFIHLKFRSCKINILLYKINSEPSFLQITWILAYLHTSVLNNSLLRILFFFFFSYVESYNNWAERLCLFLEKLMSKVKK